MRTHRVALTVMLGLILAVTVAVPTTAAQVRFRVTLSPNPMSFGSVPVGQMSAPQLLYATNRSVMPLQFATASFTARDGTIDLAFAPSPTSCFDGTHIVIKPGQTCGLTKLAFQPDSTGSFSIYGEVTFTDGVSSITVTSTAKGKGV